MADNTIAFYRLYCDYCGYNKVTDGSDCGGLREYKRSPIQRGIPQYDPAKKKIVAPEMIHLPKQFKCPGCGRLIRPKSITEVIKKNDASKSERDQDGILGPEVPSQPPTDTQSGYPKI
jgi:hypothetical protein